VTDDSREVLERPAPPPDRTIRYGEDSEHLIDLRLPPGVTGARPLVVVVHGGFWRAAYDRRHTGPQASALAAAGYVVAVPEYRRVGQDGGGWPGTFDDTARWSDALVDLVTAEVGRDAVDLGRVALVGHSAGGHLALWAASRHRLPRSSPWFRPAPLPIRGVVSLAGVCDLGLAAELRLGDGATQALMGGDPSTRPERYALADPATLLPADTASILVHGTEDPNVPVELSRRYAATAHAAGERAQLVELPGTGHFEVIDPLSAAWPAVTEAITTVLA
jgi:acetyl esterase/lipase